MNDRCKKCRREDKKCPYCEVPEDRIYSRDLPALCMRNSDWVMKSYFMKNPKP